VFLLVWFLIRRSLFTHRGATSLVLDVVDWGS